MSTPDNINQLQSNKFNFVILRLPHLEHFTTGVSIPSISIPKIEMGNPWINIPKQGDHITIGDLVVTFNADEDFKSYTEIFEWMQGIGFPENWDQRKDLGNSEHGALSDASLVVQTSAKNPNVEILFKDIWPTDISDIEFSMEVTDPPKITVTFAYRNFEVKTI